MEQIEEQRTMYTRKIRTLEAKLNKVGLLVPNFYPRTGTVLVCIIQVFRFMCVCVCVCVCVSAYARKIGTIEATLNNASVGERWGGCVCMHSYL